MRRVRARTSASVRCGFQALRPRRAAGEVRRVQRQAMRARGNVPPRSLPVRNVAMRADDVASDRGDDPGSHAQSRLATKRSESRDVLGCAAVGVPNARSATSSQRDGRAVCPIAVSTGLCARTIARTTGSSLKRTDPLHCRRRARGRSRRRSIREAASSACSDLDVGTETLHSRLDEDDSTKGVARFACVPRSLRHRSPRGGNQRDAPRKARDRRACGSGSKSPSASSFALGVRTARAARRCRRARSPRRRVGSRAALGWTRTCTVRDRVVAIREVPEIYAASLAQATHSTASCFSLRSKRDAPFDSLQIRDFAFNADRRNCGSRR